MISDGGFAYWDDLRFVSLGVFTCSACDLLGVIVSVISLFYLKKIKKKKQAV